jgi:hypothetical protein
MPGMRVGGKRMIRGARVGVGPVRCVGAGVGTTTVPPSTGTMVASALRGKKGLYESGVTVAVSSAVFGEQAVTSKAKTDHV